MVKKVMYFIATALAFLMAFGMIAGSIGLVVDCIIMIFKEMDILVKLIKEANNIVSLAINLIFGVIALLLVILSFVKVISHVKEKDYDITKPKKMIVITLILFAVAILLGGFRVVIFDLILVIRQVIPFGQYILDFWLYPFSFLVLVPQLVFSILMFKIKEKDDKKEVAEAKDVEAKDVEEKEPEVKEAE